MDTLIEGMRSLYAFWLIPIGVVWLGVFLFARNRSRADMILMGLLIGVGAVISAHFYALHDYWAPRYIFGPNLNIEDFFYGFFFGGVAAEIADVLGFYKNTDRQRLRQRFGFLSVASLLSFWFSFFIFVNLLGFNSIVGFVLTPVLIATCILCIRPDLLGNAIISGIAMSLITFGCMSLLYSMNNDIFSTYWRLEQLSGLFFFRVPIEELIFAFVVGLVTGPYYEALRGVRQSTISI